MLDTKISCSRRNKESGLLVQQLHEDSLPILMEDATAKVSQTFGVKSRHGACAKTTGNSLMDGITGILKIYPK
jgi:hypothetical protein